MDEYDGETSRNSAAANTMPSNKDRSSYDQLKSKDSKYVNGQQPSTEYFSSKLPEFVTSNFQSYSSVHSLRSESSPYSLRQIQLSIPYQYDVLLMYDPDDDIRFLNELFEHLAPQQLQIFDFNRDAPAGLPPQKVLQDTLKMCRYTCIMITQRFISNFWLQFRTDMSIQDMLDNQEKLYSVIVIVMDRTVTKYDLPLDLMTLSPLFIGDRYFKDKIKRTFSKEMPFPPSVHTTSSFAKQPLPISHLPPSYTDISRSESFPRSRQTTGDVGFRDAHRSDIYVKLPSSPNINTDANMIGLTANSESHTRSISGHPSQLSSLEPCSRLPQEHSDSTYLMPPSLFPSYNSESSAPISMAHVVQREMSITVSSTGSREPQELLETGFIDKYVKSVNEHSAVLPKTLDSSVTSASSSEGNASIETTGSSHGHRYVEAFSFLNYADGANTDQGLGNVRHEYEHPAFFSINNTDSMQSTYSDYSDLEISESSELPLTTTLENEESLHNLSHASQSTTVAPTHFSSHLRQEISYSSLPRTFVRNAANESTIPRCNSLGQDQARILARKKLSHLADDASCSSLPERSAKEIISNSTPKRSFSVRSLFGSQKSKMNKFFGGKKK